jgi:hypothetical protein
MWHKKPFLTFDLQTDKTAVSPFWENPQFFFLFFGIFF